MYYTVNAEDGRIIDGPDDRCPDPQEQANYFQCPIYIIQGQHAGLTAEPEPTAESLNLLAVCETLVTAVEEWTEDLSDVNEQARLALIQEARAAIAAATNPRDKGGQS